jgi:adenylylsulfate kinase
MSAVEQSSETIIKPFVLWFTGLPSSGKSTLAREAAAWLAALGAKVEQLDGDEVRSVFPQTGFSREERNLHLKRIGFLAGKLERNGITVVCSFVSPYAESRESVRAMCGNFVEVYVSTPVRECERRDVKGLYRKARRGEIANFTGVDDVYEVPSSPEVCVDTIGRSIEDCLGEVQEFLFSRQLVLR